MKSVALRHYSFWYRLVNILLLEDVLLLIGIVFVLPVVDTPFD